MVKILKNISRMGKIIWGGFKFISDFHTLVSALWRDSAIMNQNPRNNTVALLIGCVVVFLVAVIPTQCFSETKSRLEKSDEMKVVLDSGVVFKIKNAPFEPKQHDITQCKGKNACFIDGLRAFGTMDELPISGVVSISIDIDGKSIVLNSRGMFNAWSPREDKDVHVWISNELDSRKIIRGEFSDGAASYIVEWEVTDRGAIRTIIKCLECFQLSCNDFLSSNVSESKN